MNKSIRTQEMANLMGVTPQTIRKYVDQGSISYHRQPSGQLFFTPQDITSNLGDPNTLDNPDEKWVFYIRTSSGDKNLIKSQEEALKEYYNTITPIKIISDKASGLNENRKGLKKLITMCASGEVTDIAFTRPDRLTRFGYKYLEALFASYNVNLHHINDNKTQNIEEELIQDFMTVIASFAGKYSAMKSRSNKKALLEKALQEVDKDE